MFILVSILQLNLLYMDADEYVKKKTFEKRSTGNGVHLQSQGISKIRTKQQQSLMFVQKT